MQDITERWGVGVLDDSTAALILDLRNSGRQDLVVLTTSGPLLFINDGAVLKHKPEAFRFENPPQGTFTGMSAADYDRDGRLDLYLCTYVYFQSEDQYRYPAPYHDAQNGPPNYLFRNRLTAAGGGFFRRRNRFHGDQRKQQPLTALLQPGAITTPTAGRIFSSPTILAARISTRTKAATFATLRWPPASRTWDRE